MGKQRLRLVIQYVRPRYNWQIYELRYISHSMLLIDWFHGPFADRQLIFGWPAFWWKRSANIMQFMSGLTAATDLLTRAKKRAFHKWLTTLKSHPVLPPSKPAPEVLRASVGKLFLLMTLFLGIFACFLGLAYVGRPYAQIQFNFWQVVHAEWHTALFVAFLVSYGLTVVWTIAWALRNAFELITLTVLTTYGVTTYRFLPSLSPMFAPKRFDTSVLVVSLIFFVLSSLLLLFLS